MARIQLSKKARFEVFKRDGFTCVYCGAHPSETVTLEIDHIHPVSEGGTNDADNLVTACFDCNRGKSAELLSSVPQSLAEKAEMVAEREGQLRAYYEILEAKKQRVDEEMWAVADVLMDRFGEETILRTSLASIKRFLELLPFPVVLEAMETACNRMRNRNQAFKYFCGICWRKIKGESNGE
jgi:hypothetical protein